MNQQSPDLAEELHQAAASYTPPAVPIDRLLMRGRRRRRRRQALSVVTTVAGVAAAVTLGVVIVPHTSHNVRPQPASNVSIYHHIRFLRPPGWRETPATAHSGPDSPAAYWTNQRTVRQCSHPARGEADCAAPVKVVHRNGVLVVIGQGTSAYKGVFRPNATVAGRPALVTVTTCSHRQATTKRTGIACYPGARSALSALIQDPSIARSRGYVLFSIQAYFGPARTHLLEQQMRHVLTTARPVLTPRQHQAALDAAHRAADGYTATDPQPEEQGWPRNIVEVTASIYPTPITDPNVRHYCHTDQLLNVTLLGRFPHITVSGPPNVPGQPTPSSQVHAMDLVVTETGHTCQTSVRTGHVQPDPTAVVLFKR